MRKRGWVWLFFLFSPVLVFAKTLYVDAATSAAGDGSSWKMAFQRLGPALEAARSGDEIWVVAGSYRPGSTTGSTFRLKSHVALYGGFRGDEASREQRDWQKHPTVLTGAYPKTGSGEGHVYHVLTGAEGATLDGFVVREGQATGKGINAFGGGMLNLSAPLTIRHCQFIDNRAITGGAVFNYHQANIHVTDSLFEGNQAVDGAAMVFRDGSNALVEDTHFHANQASRRGGALFIDYGASPVIKGSQFTQNTSEGLGGAVMVDDTASQIGITRPRFIDCAFENNRAGHSGGALLVDNRATLVIRDSVLRGNHAGGHGGAVAVVKGGVGRFNGNRMQANKPTSIYADMLSTFIRDRVQLGLADVKLIPKEILEAAGGLALKQPAMRPLPILRPSERL